MAIPDDDNRRGILSKSKGQCARIAMVLHALEIALDDDENEDEAAPISWSTIVSKRSVERANVILDYLIEQKFALMHCEIAIEVPQAGAVHPLIPDRYMTKFLSFNKQKITASDVSQYRLMPPSPSTQLSKNKYPVDKVREFMQNVSEAGFGTVCEEVRAGSKRKCTTFNKHVLEDLTNTQQEALKKLRVDSSSFQPASLNEAASDFSLSTDSSANYIAI